MKAKAIAGIMARNLDQGSHPETVVTIAANSLLDDMDTLFKERRVSTPQGLHNLITEMGVRYQAVRRMAPQGVVMPTTFSQVALRYGSYSSISDELRAALNLSKLQEMPPTSFGA